MASADVLSPSLPATTFHPKNVYAPNENDFAVQTASVDLLSKLIVLEPPEKEFFDPVRHLNFQPPAKTWTMAEIGHQDKGISPIAVSDPFPLFTKDAIMQMRAEVLSKDVLENCLYSSNLASAQLRGFAAEYAPFVYDAWHSPEVLSIVSKIAQIDLIPEMDFEIAHINLSTQTEEQKVETLNAILEKQQRDADEGVSGCPWEDDKPIVDWHTDSYPFVCVTMLSDCTNMFGGETALRTGTGDVMRVRGPQMGSAVILQGRYIEHQALRALGTTERISMVTSFRPKSAFIKDDTVLTTVRAVSDLPQLYSQYSEYRLEILEERIRAQNKLIRQRMGTRRSFDLAGTKEFLAESIAFLETMMREMIDEDQVTKGFTDPSHLLSKDLKEKSKKRPRTCENEK